MIDVNAIASLFPTLQVGRFMRPQGRSAIGEEIATSQFTNADLKAFQMRLRDEMALLKTWFDDGKFSFGNFTGGAEVEAWIIDPDGNPQPKNDTLLTRLDDPLVVHELAAFNIEINTPPQRLAGEAMSSMQHNIQATWNSLQLAAADLGLSVLAIGILPTVKDADLTVENMSRGARYRALNEQILSLRRGVPIKLDISGRESLNLSHKDVMLEAAATSFQVHLKVPASEAAAYYNVSKILAAPLVAVAANSPYLFGRDLWAETRIPVFEQGVSMGRWNYCQRVTIGVRYIEDSLFEVFHANRQRYPVVMPSVVDAPLEEMRHVRLHNGTIWRWVRPIIGFEDDGTPHLRIEQRVMSAGPTVVDQIANAAFYFGLARRLVDDMEDLRWSLPFVDARENFYRAAKDGLDAKLTWADGQEGSAADLITSKLLPLAREGLETLGLNKDEISHYLGIISARAASGQNGAAWQRAFVEKHGADMTRLCLEYQERQQDGAPVHEWTC